MTRTLGLLAVLSALCTGVYAQHAPAATGDLPATGPVRVAGRVVDPRGNPVADARVTASSPAMGSILRQAITYEVRTASDGRFELKLPYGGILYTFRGEAMGFRHGEVTRLADADHSLELRLGPGPPEPCVVSGQVVDAGGAPVAGAPVELILEHAPRQRARTDATGRFGWALPMHHVGQGVLRVHHEGLVAPLGVIRGDRPETIQLVTPGRIVGKVTAGGKPVSGVEVIVLPQFVSGLCLTRASDEQGGFVFEDLGPGDYVYGVRSEEYYLHRDRPAEQEAVKVRSGQAATIKLELKPKVRIVGKVLDRTGRGVAGAVVGTQLSRGIYGRSGYAWQRTDAQGRYTLAVGLGPHPLDLLIFGFSPEHGLMRVNMPASRLRRPGGHVEAQDIALPGAAAICGTVTNAAGEPIPDVACFTEWYPDVRSATDRQGRFDMGLVTCPWGETSRDVIYRAPRPESTRRYARDPYRFPLRSRQDAPRLYYHAKQRVEAKSNRRLVLEATLEPTQLLELGGLVRNLDGEPIPKGLVCLFVGDVGVENLLRQPSLLSSFVDTSYVPPLHQTRTDAKGRWRLLFARENGVGEPPWWAKVKDWTRYEVGVVTPGGNVLWMGDVELPASRPALTDLELQLSWRHVVEAISDWTDAGARTSRANQFSVSHLGVGQGPSRDRLRELTGQAFENQDQALRWWWAQPLPASAARKGRDAEAPRPRGSWPDLAKPVGSAAWEAQLALASGGEAAVAFLAARVGPVQPDVDVDDLIDRLDDRAFAVRRRATLQLVSLAPLEKLRSALKAGSDLSPETKARLRTLIASCTEPYPQSPDTMTIARSLRVLACMETPEARAQLTRIAAGPADARLTLWAKMALQRGAILPEPESDGP